ncbi:MAG: serine/threonine-protein kinase [Pirellulaceae bacterium]|jgi:serine/threonine-protein kinase|nr:serine/threonine-protein kinase [Pirellulaceae bacterium]HJN08580.1 serine/threonine-protein kinase [Pirellulaceae bacterium]
MLKSDKLDVDERFERLRSAISGTMSNFYMARDRETKNIVGLKIAKQDKLKLFEARFKGLNKPSEGEIASSLHHPNVVETTEFGLTTENLPYTVMEYLDGPGLHELIHNRDQILSGKRLNLIRQMAEALAYVHEQEFIHRDVCPRNFIVMKDMSTLKLIDFGLTLPATPDFTQPGNRTGTPNYMAPEIMRRKTTDQRLDIFSFGVSVYHLCAFELPWPKPPPEKAALAAIAHDTVEPRNIREYMKNINSELADAIMSCLAPDPRQRPQTLKDFLETIREIEGEFA